MPHLHSSVGHKDSPIKVNVDKGTSLQEKGAIDENGAKDEERRLILRTSKGVTKPHTPGS